MQHESPGTQQPQHVHSHCGQAHKRPRDKGLGEESHPTETQCHSRLWNSFSCRVCDLLGDICQCLESLLGVSTDRSRPGCCSPSCGTWDNPGMVSCTDVLHALTLSLLQVHRHGQGQHAGIPANLSKGPGSCGILSRAWRAPCHLTGSTHHQP